MDSIDTAKSDAYRKAREAVSGSTYNLSCVCLNMCTNKLQEPFKVFVWHTTAPSTRGILQTAEFKESEVIRTADWCCLSRLLHDSKGLICHIDFFSYVNSNYHNVIIKLKKLIKQTVFTDLRQKNIIKLHLQFLLF